MEGQQCFMFHTISMEHTQQIDCICGICDPVIQLYVEVQQCIYVHTSTHFHSLLGALAGTIYQSHNGIMTDSDTRHLMSI